jgi:hypothetical protein
MARPVTKRDVQHLYRRAGFGSPPVEAYALAGQSVDSLANYFLTWRDDTAVTAEASLFLRDRTTDYGLVYPSVDGVFDYLYHILAKSPNQFHERLAMIGLHDRLSTAFSAVGGYSTQQYAAQLAKEHIELLRSAGRSMDYRDLVLRLGEDMLMALWLNIDGSLPASPNQNYARELMELFTLDTMDDLGRPNYTIADIREVARAFTGWRVESGYFQGGPPGRWLYRIRFNSANFDAGQKTIFAGTAWEGRVTTGRDVVNHIFDAHPNAPVSLAKWMAREYIGSHASREIITELAQVLRQSNFNLRPAFERLFRSGYFYADDQHYAILKHPSEREIHLLRVLHNLGWAAPAAQRSRGYSNGSDTGCYILWNFTVFGCDREKELPFSGRLLLELRAQDRTFSNSLRDEFFNPSASQQRQLVGAVLQNGDSIEHVLNHLSDLFGIELSAVQRSELTFWLNHVESYQLREQNGQYEWIHVMIDSPWDPTLVQGSQGTYYRDSLMLTKLEKVIRMMSQLPQVMDVH